MSRRHRAETPARRLRSRLVVQAAVLSLVAGGTAAFASTGMDGIAGIDGHSAALPTGTTAADASALLSLVGPSAEVLRGELRVPSSRSAGVARDALRTSVPVAVQVSVDGTTHQTRTSASTVRDVLLAEGVVLGPHDRVSVPLDGAVVDGLVVLVTRVTAEVRTDTTTHAFQSVREEDPGLDEGREVVAQQGQDGAQVVTYEALLVGEEEVGRTVLAQVTLREPVDEVVRVGTRVVPPEPVVPASAPVDPGTARAVARDMVLARGWGEDQFACLDALWTKESNWRVTAENRSSGAYGIPQSLPGSKMASAGADWRTNATTQITWGLGYIAGRYGTPCAAWAHSQARNWY